MKRNAESDSEPVPAVSWKRFDLAAINAAEFSPSKSQYGGWSGTWSYGAAFKPVLFTGPAMRVLHEPSVWDEQKQAKWGKSGKALDADRKADKWSIDLEVSDAAFEAFLETLIARYAESITAQQSKFLPPGAKSVSREVIESKFYAILKTDKKTGVKSLGFDGRCEVGAKEVPLVLEDTDGQPIHTGIGKNSVVYPVIKMSSVRIAEGLQNVKLYVDPVKFVVKTLVPPSDALAPAAVKPDIED